MAGASKTATFGSALAAAGMAGTAAANVVGLQFSPATVNYPASTFVQVSGTAAGTAFGSFFAYNDSFGKSFGSNFFAASPSIPFFTTVASGSTIAPLSIVGNYVYGTAGSTGTLLAAFETAGGLVGWLRVDFGGLGLPVRYLEGAIETNGGSIIAGQGPDVEAPVPLPATLPLAALGTLALGAAGLRRRRQAGRQQTA